ncbi:MAG: hypothetical protein ACKOA9_03325 [Actinomycetota bacterium]
MGTGRDGWSIEQTQEYVQMLEQEYDRRNDTAIPTADDLGEAFERFLREQDDENG